jgi:8-oxo-dGTP pyrophosphatase MutT (NUDIX family)
MPGEWAATGGAAISGESSFEAAKRELFEELGIPSTEETLKQILHLKRRNTILDIWAITCDTDPKDLKLQKNEVAEVRLVTVEEFNEMVKSGNFHNYGNDYFEQVLSAITARKGATV